MIGEHCTQSCGEHGVASGDHNHHCSCSGGYHGSFCQAPADYSGTYTIRGCASRSCAFYELCSSDVCGIYNIIPGKTCDGAPVYQSSGGNVLYRFQPLLGSGRWWVSDSTALDSCGSATSDDFGSSETSNIQGPPTSSRYSPWTDIKSFPDRKDITVASGR